MKQTPDRLLADLADARRPLQAVYVILGEEPLCAMETADALLRAARERGPIERQRFDAATGFDWSLLDTAMAARSLFGEHTLVDVDLPTGRPGTAGGQAIQRALAAANAAAGEVLLLLRLPRPDGDLRRAAWFRALEASATVVHCRPVPAGQMARWMLARAAAAGVRLDAAAADLAAQWLDGNLSAAAQAIDAWRLAGVAEVGPEQVIADLVDDARFGLFDLSTATLGGDAPESARRVHGLLASGVAPQLILWLLARDLRALLAEAMPSSPGGGRAAFLPGVAPEQVRSAAHRLGRAGIEAQLQFVAEIDRAVKGRAGLDVERALIQVATAIAGTAAVHPARFWSGLPALRPATRASLAAVRGALRG